MHTKCPLPPSRPPQPVCESPGHSTGAAARSLAQTADRRPASLLPLSTHRCCRRSPAAPLLPIDIALRLNKVTQDILRRKEREENCLVEDLIVAQFRARLAHDDVRRGRRNNTFCKQSVRSADCLRIFPSPSPASLPLSVPVRLIRRHLAIFRL